MISYEPFWKTLQERGISTYALINKLGILPDTVQRIRANKPVTTKTLNSLCEVLGCEIEDIIKYWPDEMYMD